MSGWLPFEQQLYDIFGCDEPTELAENYVCEARSDGQGISEKTRKTAILMRNWIQMALLKEHPLIIQAVGCTRDVLDLPLIPANDQSPEDSLSLLNLPQLHTQFLVGNGTEDQKISILLGDNMFFMLSKFLKMNVTWKPYQGLGHWYRVEDQIEDILKFHEAHVRIPL
ncbi:Phospholipase/carboxylesterase/thioesterase [Penicillium macrosclerotiorum]|uniref:Phospholipase/carboxylesterase/thioesterase n=1 Tax=Penicillium macrosclerotiorum TaxID=303699 RepID=UPI0025492C75|nr:Phospholipase/carboxylesterase/thioesterase [Penicillium macrosclerotiorum]KAJ5669533.1 Phospholipase/carboxylesterase/thioesterase [Penicillium macrosclerotiorum]